VHALKPASADVTAVTAACVSAKWKESFLKRLMELIE